MKVTRQGLGHGVGSGRGFEGDLVAEGFELADVVAPPGVGVDVSVVVVGAELVIVQVIVNPVRSRRSSADGGELRP